MWQVEDLVRASRFDAEAIRRNVVSRYHLPPEEKDKVCRWYGDIMEMMRAEGVMDKGHIRQNADIAAELESLHRRLLASPEEEVYRAAYYKALPCIVELRAKSGGEEMAELETCFTAVYGYLTLKLQQKEISAETEKAVGLLASFLAMLAAKYREAGKQENKKIGK